jgi:hypothetical protein
LLAECGPICRGNPPGGRPWPPLDPDAGRDDGGGPSPTQGHFSCGKMTEKNGLGRGRQDPVTA